jgi:hypothetical protein
MLVGDLCSWRSLIFFVQLLWTIFLWWLAAEKWALFGTYSYFSHLTNIGWTLEALLFTFTLPFFVSSTTLLCNVQSAAACMALCFAPIWLLAWFIAATVYLLLVHDPEFITDLFETIEPGLVIVGNDLFHIIPLIALIFLGAVHFRLLYFGMNRMFTAASRRCGGFGLAVVGVYLAFGGTLIIIAFYCLMTYLLGTSPQERYKTDLSYGAGVANFFAVALLFNIVPLVALCSCCNVCRPSRTPRYDEARAMSKLDDEIFGERLAAVDRAVSESMLELAITSEERRNSSPTPAVVPVASRRLNVSMMRF